MRIPKEKSGPRDNVLLVWKDKETGEVIKTASGHNLVTNAGDKHYAQRAASEATSLTFTKITVAASIKAVSKGATFGDLVNAADVSQIPSGGSATFDAGYPTTSDSDTDNTGADSDIVTWRASYTTSEANTNIKVVVISQTGADTGGGGSTELLLNAVTLAVSEPKTSSSTLKVFVNHQFLGVAP